jgi:hypothetical protein
LSPRQAREWMNLAATTHDIENGSALPFSGIRETVRETRNNPNYGKPAAWRETVERAREEASRVAYEHCRANANASKKPSWRCGYDRHRIQDFIERVASRQRRIAGCNDAWVCTLKDTL